MVPLQQAREGLGISQKELARKTGVQQASISLGERGSGLSKANAAKMARFFGHPWHELHFLYPERYEIPEIQEQKAS